MSLFCCDNSVRFWDFSIELDMNTRNAYSACKELVNRINMFILQYFSFQIEALRRWISEMEYTEI